MIILAMRCENHHLSLKEKLKCQVYLFYFESCSPFLGQHFAMGNISVSNYIKYCCRDDSAVSNDTFKLDILFYLFPTTDSCYNFTNYRNVWESVTYKIYNSSKPRTTGSFPYHDVLWLNDSTYELTLYYCLYEPINPITSLSVPTGTIMELNSDSKFVFEVTGFNSMNKRAVFGIDSNALINISITNTTCQYLDQVVNLVKGSALVNGRLCTESNSSILSFHVNLDNNRHLPANVELKFQRKFNALFLFDQQIGSLSAQLALSLSESSITYEILILNETSNIFMNALEKMKLEMSDIPSKIHSVAVMNPGANLNEILSVSEGYNVSSIIFDIHDSLDFRIVPQVRYVSFPETINLLPILTNEVIQNSNGIVIYRIPGALSLLEFHAIHRTLNILRYDTILYHKNSVEDQQVDILRVCVGCVVFLFLDSSRASLLMSKVISRGFQLNVVWFSFSPNYIISNTFIREPCQKANPPCHVAFRNMWSVFHSDSHDCTGKADDLLMQPVNNLTSFVHIDIPNLVLNDMIDINEQYVNYSRISGKPISTKKFVNFIDSKPHLETACGLSFLKMPFRVNANVLHGSIMCQPGWDGNHCNIPVCSISSCNTKHGSCIAPETCQCEDNWFGHDCTGDCALTCINGICNDGAHGSGKCKSCNWLYLGEDCTDQSIIYGFIAAGVGTSVVTIFVVCYAIKILQTQEQNAEAKEEASEKDFTLSWNDLESIEDIDFTMKVTHRQISKKLKYIAYQKGVLFSGQEVFIKSYLKPHFQLSLGVKTELKTLCTLEHNNIERMVGIMLNNQHLGIVTANANMGSLYDVLHEKHIPITWDVRYSIMQDICRGMAYLHDVTKMEYGRLKSTNCLLHQGMLMTPLFFDNLRC